MPLAAWLAMFWICSRMLICWVSAPSAVCTSEIAWLTLDSAWWMPPIWVVNPCAAIYPAGLSAGLLIDCPDDSSCSRVFVVFAVLFSESNA